MRMATEDYYGDGDTASAPPARARAKPVDSDDESSSQTTTIAKSLCPGMEVGDIIKLEITGVLEDEYQVRYVKKDEDDDGSDDGEGMEDEEMAMSMSNGMYE